MSRAERIYTLQQEIAQLEYLLSISVHPRMKKVYEADIAKKQAELARLKPED